MLHVYCLSRSLEAEAEQGVPLVKSSWGLPGRSLGLLTAEDAKTKTVSEVIQ